MRQADLNRAVARATGETVDFIKGMGFSPLVLKAPKPHSRRRRRHQRYRPLVAVCQSA